MRVKHFFKYRDINLIDKSINKISETNLRDILNEEKSYKSIDFISLKKINNIYKNLVLVNWSVLTISLLVYIFLIVDFLVIIIVMHENDDIFEILSALISVTFILAVIDLVLFAYFRYYYSNYIKSYEMTNYLAFKALQEDGILASDLSKYDLLVQMINYNHLNWNNNAIKYNSILGLIGITRILEQYSKFNNSTIS